MEPYNSLYFENRNTQIPKTYESKITKIVVKTEPIEIKALFFACIVPNLKSMDMVIKIIRITKTYLPKMIKGILSLNTS